MRVNMILGILSLVIWIWWLVYGIRSIINKTEVDRGTFICAVIVCILASVRVILENI